MVNGVKGLGEVQKDTKCVKAIVNSCCNVIYEIEDGMRC